MTQPHAPRVERLESKRIGFVSNEQWLRARPASASRVDFVIVVAGGGSPSNS